jgi:polyisoprenoid-binding protein YceI
MSQTQASGTIEGIEIPEPGDWQLDPVHTSVEFVARHLMVSKVRGKFTEVEGSSPSHFLVHGDLSVHGITRPVALDVEYHGVTSDPWGGRRAGFSASTELNREDFDLTWNIALEAGGVVVGKKIRLEFEIEAVHQD